MNKTFPSFSELQSLIYQEKIEGDNWNYEKYREWYKQLSHSIAHTSIEELSALAKTIIEDFKIPF